MMPDRINVPVSIPSGDLADYFTASSMRVCRSFFLAQNRALEDVGDPMTRPSVCMARSFFLAQINEADAHGIGSASWVSQMSGCVERIELRMEDGISREEWADQMAAFVDHLTDCLRRSGLSGSRDLPCPRSDAG